MDHQYPNVALSMGLGCTTPALPETDLSEWMPSLHSFWEKVFSTEEAIVGFEKHDETLTQLKCEDQLTTEEVLNEPPCKRTRLSSTIYSSGCDDEIFDKSRLTFKDPLSLKEVVLRSTRFSVVVPMEVAISTFVDFCIELGTIAKQRGETEFLVTFKPNMSFVMNAYEFSDTSGTRVIVDCRRSRGCGIAFKRIFNHFKKKMQPIIYCDDDDWMKNVGLTRRN